VKPVYWPLGDDAFVRSFAVDDAPALFALIEAERERLDQWFPWTANVSTVEDQRVWIEACLASATGHDGNGIWAGGQVAGTIGMSVSLLENSGEIGYWLGSAFEGRGLMTRACERMLAFGFEDLRLHRITIRTATHNERSRAVAQRLGFVHEGTIREQGYVATGEYHDLDVFGLLDREWRARS
jgi:ribosomal-protein-serine acetyltransferase